MKKYIFALGFFDGVHLGHGALLRACRETADRLGILAGAVTFSVHPDGPVTGNAPALINSGGDKQYLMQSLYHMDQVLFLPFDREMMNTAWQDFFRMLIDRYHAAGFVCGQDYRFGYRGTGNAEKLQALCADNGLPCTVIPQQKMDGRVISSAAIRELLLSGDMDTARRFLGHPHLLTGTVVHGRQIGRTLGTPTANIQPQEPVLELRHGVYACMAEVSGSLYQAVVNVGNRPTVAGNHVTVEAWLPDFSGDLYGKRLRLFFYRFLRPEQKFESLTDLYREIEKNRVQTREFFESL